MMAFIITHYNSVRIYCRNNRYNKYGICKSEYRSINLNLLTIKQYIEFQNIKSQIAKQINNLI